MKILYYVLALLLSAGVAQAQKPATLDHVALLVQNLDSSAAFYTRLFELPELPNAFPKARVKWYRIGSQIQLHLIEGLKAPVQLPQLAHLCLSVPTVEGFVLKLKKAGIAYYNGLGVPNTLTVRGDGVKQVFLQDPNGYWLEANDAAHN